MGRKEIKVGLTITCDTVVSTEEVEQIVNTYFKNLNNSANYHHVQVDYVESSSKQKHKGDEVLDLVDVLDNLDEGDLNAVREFMEDTENYEP